MARLTHVGRLSKSRKLGIGGRLILSFAVVAVLTAGAGSASSWLAIRGATIMDRIGSRTLPTVTASLTFAQRSSVLAAAAPALALQKDQASLQSEGAKLKALIAEQKSRIAELRSLMENSSMLDPIEKSSDQLAGKIGEIETLASKRADLTDAINKKVSETLSAHQDFTDAVHPLVELTQTVVDRSLGDITSEDATRTGSIAARLKSKEMPALKALMDLEAAGNIVNGMLAAAANAPNNDSSTDIRTQYEWGELSLNQDVETLGAGFGEGKLASTGKALLADGSGRDSIFALRERRATTDADIAASLEALVKITSTLAHQVEQLVESEKSAAAESVLESGAVARQSLLVNAVLSGIVVLVSALIGWLYVGRVVVRRLNSLASNMGRLATGDISVEINSWGDDEITAMARSVEVFKNNIIRGDELAREADVNASDRESVRTRTDAERATAAEEQAAVVAGLAAGLSHLAKGDLTYELHDAFPEDYEALRQDFNLTVSQLRSVMQQIVVNSSALQTGAGEISAAADNLSRRTEQQAASLEETAAALGQITATVRQTAQGANHVQEIVGTAKVDVELSGQVVREAVDAMSGIEQSSAKISQIISVIDEIAFQTNLLALNAGVEAARAGDSGRGFAVVASEVRALAQRSAGAAKEIKALILASEQQVDRGVSLVGQTGQVLERIVGQVAKINAIVVEIAASAKEQATGLHQVNTAVNEMDQVTQQNAAMVEQSTAASHALARETQDLNRLISRFEVNKPGIVGSSEGVRRASSPGVRTRSLKTVAENGMPLRPTKPNRDYRASA